MSGKKADPRIEHSRNRIKQTFYTLSTEKPFKSITVKNITDLANISRSTFYAHYRDTLQLLIEFLSEGGLLLDNAVFEKENHEIFEGFLVSTTKNMLFFKQNPELTLEVLNNYQKSSYYSDFYTINLKHQFAIQRVLEYDNLTNFIPDKILADYCIAGLGRILQLWINENLQYTPAEISNYIIRLNMSTICGAKGLDVRDSSFYSYLINQKNNSMGDGQVL
ncbi:MAG: TetR/AcrR family transcriptional regulator [Anaerolineaceae bacterium]|nr:TetR/AcrR family transcriptional regulator [Anaerolineaceae bacterium]